MSLDFRNKYILITGGSKRIGLEIALQLTGKILCIHPSPSW